MSNACDLIINKKSRVGNMVSHSNIKTKRMFHVNLQETSLHSNVLNRDIFLKLTTRTIKTVMKYGNIDNFLLRAKPRNLTSEALKLKKLIISVMKKKNLLSELPRFQPAKRNKPNISERLRLKKIKEISISVN